MKIYLVGMPLCGKTTTGRALSLKLHLNFFDLDAEIERKNHYFIEEIFAEYGEKTFRILETEALKNLIDEKNCIISCGGGIVENSLNRDLMNGTIVFLNAEYSVLASRFQESTESRPVLKKKSLRDLFDSRREKYEAFKEIEIKIRLEESLSVDEIVDKIIEELKIC